MFVATVDAAAAVTCTLVVAAADGRVLHESGDCAARSSPASTFKIPLAVMGFDAGILRDAHAPVWPYREDYRAPREPWKRPTDPAYWLKESVVWYSQQLTQQIGMPAFRRYVDRFGYGNRDLSGDPGRGNGLTRAWLSSSLQVSPREQVAFLRRLLQRGLPAAPAAQEKTMAALPVFPLDNGWTVRGKTGAGSQPKRSGGGLDADRQFGWFVGWAEKDARAFVFARLVRDEGRMDSYASYRARDGLLAALPDLLPQD